MVLNAERSAVRHHTRVPGATFISKDECRFKVWAPLHESLALHLLDPDEMLPMEKDAEGFFTIVVQNIRAGRNYFFKPGGEEDIPDPASHYQHDTVHGPSQVVDHNKFKWTDHKWRGIPFKDIILYELHVGTFTEDGTFEAVIP